MVSRHRATGRARVGGRRRTERVLLVTALCCSAVAVVLSITGWRPAAIVVAAGGLGLAVVALLLGSHRFADAVADAVRRRVRP